jgi:hypothetical protein
MAEPLNLRSAFPSQSHASENQGLHRLGTSHVIVSFSWLPPFDDFKLHYRLLNSLNESHEAR